LGDSDNQNAISSDDESTGYNAEDLNTPIKIKLNKTNTTTTSNHPSSENSNNSHSQATNNNPNNQQTTL
jgi:hypothetical protein